MLQFLPIHSNIFVSVERGLVVGKDIFIVGFGDLPLAQQMPVPLTSVDEKAINVGYTAAKVLYESIVDRQSSPVYRLISTKLIIRQSSINPEQGAVEKKAKKFLALSSPIHNTTKSVLKKV
jgi:substrate-binding family protein